MERKIEHETVERISGDDSPSPAPSPTPNHRVDNREFVYHANDSVLESAFEDAKIHAKRGSSQGTHFLSC
jgi:hypothetical protein